MADQESQNNQQMISVTQMQQIVEQMFKQMNIQTKPTVIEFGDLKVSEKLTFHNYTKWCRLIYIALEPRGRLHHITAKPPSPTDPTYVQWKQNDSLVFSWKQY